MKTIRAKAEVALTTLLELFTSAQVSVVPIRRHVLTLTILAPGMKVPLWVKRVKALSVLKFHAD